MKSNPTDPAKPTTAATRLSVVVVNYNGWPDVLRLVGELADAPDVSAGRCEVLIVDNASEGPIPAGLSGLGRGVRLIPRGDNGGFAAGVNAGWHESRSPWLLVLNPDVVLPAAQLGAILARVDRFERDPGGAPGIVGFGLRNPDGSPQPSVGSFPSLLRTVYEQLIPRPRRKYQSGCRIPTGPVPWVTGACILVNARLLESLGGMDEDFFLYYEEVALCRAAQDQGWRVEYDPGVEVAHLHPLQNRAISPRMRVITRHSKLLYFRKHLPHWQFLMLSAAISAEARMGRWFARVRGEAEEGRAWRTIHEVARAFRAGVEPRGRDVLRLAESVTATTPGRGGGRTGTLRRREQGRDGGAHDGPPGPGKDGPECR